ncbi:MAG: hypothetical protein M1829_004060 [Trizodia sp. TS-e1964]|nr:MAG: hypothetical protein M1829_004060 [Trizodia sp. TS-e1964]
MQFLLLIAFLAQCFLFGTTFAGHGCPQNSEACNTFCLNNGCTCAGTNIKITPSSGKCVIPKSIPGSIVAWECACFYSCSCSDIGVKPGCGITIPKLPPGSDFGDRDVGRINRLHRPQKPHKTRGKRYAQDDDSIISQEPLGKSTISKRDAQPQVDPGSGGGVAPAAEGDTMGASSLGQSGSLMASLPQCGGEDFS